jgi:hypothetical protein
VAIGDLNLDGNLDVVADDANSNQLSVLRGKGDGTFQAPINFSGIASGLAIGDFNGDGKPDLAGTDFPNGRIFIWSGLGDGTFSGPSTVSAGPGVDIGTKTVVASDLNKDGKLDLVAVNMFSSNIAVLLGNGDGTFKPVVNYPVEVASGPQGLAVGDINGDGKPDIIVGETGIFNVAVFLGVGDGSLTNAAYFNATQPAWDVALGDVNGDGKVDVIAATNRGTTNTSFATILPGNNNGTLGVAQDFAVDAGALAVAVGDFNRDGKLDIVVAASSSNGASVLLNTSPIINTSPATLSVNRTSLNFGYSGQSITSPQTITVNIGGASNVGWSVSSNRPNIMVSPASGVGSGSFQVTAVPGTGGMVTVTAAAATGSPQQIQVNVNSVATGMPFGSFDTPLDNTAGISGAVAVSGWALDSVEVTNVGVWREPVPNEPTGSNGLVFIGDAVLVADARPDVRNAFPSYPNAYRAGWGYLMLTTGIPNSNGSGPLGNGAFKLHVLVTNAVGQTLDLGTHSITLDNAHAAKPFGSIDTPSQGGTASGSQFVNFGWTLTQNPYCIPADGSTITVTVDGVALGHPAYNQLRSDIANSFPGLCNTNGPVGFFYIDTTKLTNGVHTIGWLAYDNGGRGDGLGSRFFNVLNSGSAATPEEPPTAESLASGVRLRSGYDPNPSEVALVPDPGGSYFVEIEELGRVELSLGASKGFMIVAGLAEALPLGSMLKAGVFYWQAPVGFLGSYELLFEQPNGSEIPVRVKIVPKRFSRE